MELIIFMSFLMLLCLFQTFAENCISTNKLAMRESKDKKRRISNLWVTTCVAQCLNLSFKNADSCNYSLISGLQTGMCTPKFQPNTKNDKKLLCNIENLYNPNTRFNLTKLIKAGLCTHISLAPFFMYHKGKGTFTVFEDLAESYADDFKIAPAFGAKILLSVGEFYDFDGAAMHTNNYANVAATEQSRASFVNQMTDFIFKYNLRGIVINWLSPGCVKFSCPKVLNVPDKSNYIKLLREFRQVLKPEMMEIIISLPAAKDWLLGYDLEEMFPLVDYFQLCSFNQGTHEWKYARQPSPLAPTRKMFEILKKYASKILAGINSRIDIFKLVNQLNNQAGAKTIPLQGFATSYDQICKRVRSNTSAFWNESRSNSTDSNFLCKEEPRNHLSKRVCEFYNSTEIVVFRDSDKGNYATFDTNWFPFENKESLRKKVDLLNEFGSPGIFLFSVNYDDANNSCGCLGDFTLTRTIAELLRANDGCSMKPCF